MLRGPWVPAFAGKTRGGRKAGAQEPWWCRCHGTGLSAVGFSPARCAGGFKKKALSVLRRLGWFDVLLVAIQCSVVPGSRRSPGKRRVGKRGPRNRGGAAATERTSAQQVFHRYSVQSSLKTSALRAAEPLVVRCPFGCRPELGGPWVPAFAGKTRGEGSGGPRAAVAARSRSGPQRSGGSAGTVRRGAGKGGTR